jgi:taurine dioxygenase
MTTLGERPITPAIGAQITGVQLGGSLGDEIIGELKKALLRYRVIFIRSQHRLDEQEQVAFTRKLGAITTAHPTMRPHDDNKHILDLDYQKGGRADYWHTDATFVDAPPAISVLRAVVLPPHGKGDTLWANTVNAYRTLPSGLRAVADTSWALHSNMTYDAPPTHGVTDTAAREHSEQFRGTVFEAEHPVVRIHPDTGERALLLGHFARAIVGASTEDASTGFIRTLQDHITQADNIVRWQWSPGDVAIWDNRATQHRVVEDWGNYPRRLHRVTVAGSPTIALDDRRSFARQGSSTTYLAG